MGSLWFLVQVQLDGKGSLDGFSIILDLPMMAALALVVSFRLPYVQFLGRTYVLY
jgi:hypothetical protein